MSVSSINLEFLREGPPHGQLLSPLTRYLVTMGTHPSASMTLPFEQMSFDQLIRDLRYQTDSLTDADRRRLVLETTGRSIAHALSQVPGLTSSLSAGERSSLLHMRLVLSASELATIPWELSKDPSSPELSSENWLVLQSRTPTVLTRHVRSISTLDTKWNRKPRVLFAYSNAGGTVPHGKHRKALEEALAPWAFTQAQHAGGRALDDLLTVVKDASYAKIARETAQAHFTHVHILAHGGVEKNTAYQAFGLALHDDDESSSDIVAGQRFIQALRRTDATGASHVPTVVTIAGCDSGNVGSLVRTGASFAHALHEGGVPFVVASQFPLSIGGSVRIVERLYEDLLWAHHPLWSIHRIRTGLFGHQSNENHDWATLVVYEALPADFEEQREAFQYRQHKAALDAALDELDATLKESTQTTLETIDARITHAQQGLPRQGRFAAESQGLIAASYKRMAEGDFHKRRDETTSSTTADVDRCIEHLKLSRKGYHDAMRVFIDDCGTAVQQIASFHWLGTQAYSLDFVLGESEVPGLWETVNLIATMHLERARDDEAKAWSYGTLLELALLRAGSCGDEDEAAEYEAECDRKLGALLKLYPNETEFPHYSTKRQLNRYPTWWADADFIAALRRHRLVDDQRIAQIQDVARLAEQLVRAMEAPNGREAH